MRELNIHLPQSWAELSPRQLIGISSLFLQENLLNGFLTKAFILLSGLSIVRKDPEKGWYWFCFRRRDPFLISREAICFASNRVSFLLDPVDRAPVPWKPLRFLAQSPDIGLYKLTVAQYLNAENSFAAYQATGEDRHLNQLILALWKPIHLKAILRKMVRNMDPAQRNACMLFYTGCRNFLAVQFPLIYRPVPGGSGDDGDITSLIRALNGGDVTRNETIMDCHLWDALKQLEEMAEQSEKILKMTRR